MPRLSLDFQRFKLFEDEEAGDTYVTVYAVIRDSNNNQLATFASNFRGRKINESDIPYDLTDATPHVFDLDVTTPVTITVSAFADDDADDYGGWPTAGTNENDLGSKSSPPIDPQNQNTLGSIIIGPTTTDQGNKGYEVTVEAKVVPERHPIILETTFKQLLLYEDEEAGDTYMAIYVFVQSPFPGTNGVIFRWNNGNNKVDEGPDPNSPNSYGLGSGGSQNPIQLTLFGPATMWVEGYADDDADDYGFWPSAAQNENYLGSSDRLRIDPDNIGTVLGQRQLGPTVTDRLHTGYQVQLVITSQ